MQLALPAVYIIFEVLLSSDALDIPNWVSILFSSCLQTIVCFCLWCIHPLLRHQITLLLGSLSGSCRRWLMPPTYSFLAPQALPVYPPPSCHQTTVDIANTSFLPILLPSALLQWIISKKWELTFVEHFKSFLCVLVWINMWVLLCSINSSHDSDIQVPWKVSLES